LNKPIGRNGDEKFTLESILASPTNETTEESDNGDNGLYKKIVDFLLGEYFSQKKEKLELKKGDRAQDRKTEVARRMAQIQKRSL
jgi:hypothetical protein